MMTEERVNQRFAGANVTIEGTLDEVTGWQFVMNNKQGQHIDVYPSGYRIKGRMSEEELKKLKKWLKERLAKDLAPEITAWIEENSPPITPARRLDSLTDAFLITALVAHIASAAGQHLIPHLLASPGYWGYAPGWQFEIGWWNVGIIVLIVATLRGGEASLRSTSVLVLSALWFGFAINHTREPIHGWHGYLAAAEFIGGIIGFILFIVMKSPKRS
jgi:hypothetical protein